MFVPDGVEKRVLKLPPAAGSLYLHYCRWRDHTTRLSYKTFEKARAELKLARATAYRAHKKLLDAHWIKELPDGKIMPLGGSFAPVNKLTDAAWREWYKGEYSHHGSGLKNETAHNKERAQTSLKVETEDDTSLKNETENLIFETKSLKNETAHNKERARGFSSTSSSTLSSNTHTQVLDAQPARAREDDEARTCVCGFRYTLEDLRRYARNQTPPLRDPEAWVGKAFDECFRHAQIADWLKRQKNGTAEPKVATESCPDCKGTGYYFPDPLKPQTARCRHPKLVEARAHSPPTAA